MIIATSTQQANRIFDFVQTILNIDDEEDLEIVSITPNTDGLSIIYTIYTKTGWENSKFVQLWNSQMILLSTFIKNEQESKT